MGESETSKMMKIHAFLSFWAGKYSLYEVNKSLIQPTLMRKGCIQALYINMGHIISSVTVLSYHDLSCSAHLIQLSSYLSNANRTARFSRSRVLERDEMSNPGK